MPEWRYTTDHAASSYGIPVLVSPDGTAYGPADLLSTGQAAAALGVTTRRVQALIQDGRLLAQRVGERYVIRAGDLEAVRERPPGRPRLPGPPVLCVQCGAAGPVAGYCQEGPLCGDCM